MSNYRIEFDSIAGPKDSERLCGLLSMLSRGDELEIAIDSGSDTQEADSVIGVLRRNEFDVFQCGGNKDGKYRLLARRR